MSQAATLGVLGITGVGLTAGGIFLWNHFSDGMPQYHSLAKDNNYASNGYTNKFGESYKDYLVGIAKASTGITPESNDNWWNWSYEIFKAATTEHKGKFKTVEKAIGSSTDAKALREVCEAAYKESSTESSPKITTTDPSDNNNFKESDIWKYCSPLGKKPSTISSRTEEANQYQNNLGSNSTHNTKLVSVLDEENNKFWDLKQSLFFSGTAPSESEKYFKKFYDDNKDKQEALSLKGACEKAYKMTANTSTSSESAPKTDEVVKYCSLEGK